MEELDYVAVRQVIEEYKDMQFDRVRTGNRIICILRDTIKPQIKISDDGMEVPDEIKIWDKETIDLLLNGKFKELLDLLSNNKIKCPPSIADLLWHYNKQLESEKEFMKRLDARTKNHLFRYLYLDNIIGLGPIASTGIIAWLAPLSRFPNPSKLRRYCGWGMDEICVKCNKHYFKPERKIEWENKLISQGKDPKKYLCYCEEPKTVFVVQKKRKGMLLTFSPKLKSFIYNIATNFIKNKRRSWYGRYYEAIKQEVAKNRPEWNKLQIHYKALRKMINTFLNHIWASWWIIIEKQNPPVNPYVIDMMKHRDIIYPVVDAISPPIVLKDLSSVDALWEMCGEMRKRRRK